jgi:signal transduction histidine kinase
MRVPIRARITAAFAVVMLVLVGAIAAIAYLAMGNALQDEIDTGLRFRAVSVLQALPSDPEMVPDARLQEPTEAFVQVLTAAGRIVSATRGFTAPVLSPSDAAVLHRSTFLQREVAGVAGTARILAVPFDQGGVRGIVVVGATTTDRRDALHELAEVLLVGGPAAVALACVAAWTVAGWALRPVDRMRAQASAITASGLDRRLTVPRTRDELQRLARTLNDMLDRLGNALTSERAFLERAGHELRTPLAALRAEVDLALRRRRTPEELAAALESVSQETDRLARLADDLLVLARASAGRLPIHRESVDLPELLESVVRLFGAQAHSQGISLTVTATEGAIEADPVRLRQVLTNLLANALRHTPRGGSVRLVGAAAPDAVRIEVTDTGPGFDHTGDEPGLGLRIVIAIVESHGGTVRIGRGESGGACVEVRIPQHE